MTWYLAGVIGFILTADGWRCRDEKRKFVGVIVLCAAAAMGMT